jgi:hypothetical protein
MFSTPAPSLHRFDAYRLALLFRRIVAQGQAARSFGGFLSAAPNSPTSSTAPPSLSP